MIPSDLPYALDAAEKYCAQQGTEYDEDHSREFILRAMEIGHVFVATENGEPVGHSGAIIAPDFYSPNLTARVFTTWGKGGLQCLKYVTAVVKMHGAKKIIADAPTGSRLRKIYERMGYDHTYDFFIKDL